MPDSLPRLADFSAAVAKLGEQTTLRLKTDGSGLATTRWEGFQVRFHDFLFRDKNEIALDKAKTQRVFLETVARERGEELSGIAAHEIGLQGAKLKGKAVSDTVRLLTEHGGENWLQNERLIRQVAYSDAENQTEKPSLSKTTAPARIVVSLAAGQDLLETGDVEQLNAYTVCAETRGKQDLTLPVLSGRIASALRQTVRREAEDGVYIDRLDADEATRIGGAVAREFMTGKINDLVFQRFEERFPLADVVDPKLDSAALAWLSGREHAAVRDSKHLLKPEDLRRMRDALIDGYVESQLKKAEHVDTLADALPDSEYKDRFVEACMASPAPMDARYFGRLAQVATTIETLMDRPTEKNSNVFIPQWLALGKTINAFFSEGEANELETFVRLSVALFAAQSFTGALRAASTWITNDMSDKLVRAPIKKMSALPAPEEGASALSAVRVFEQLAAIASDKAELDRRISALPTLAEIGNRELAALVAQAERKGLSKDAVATIRALYLDVFRGDAENTRKFDIGILPLASLEAEFDGAVKWKETEGTKPPNEREQKRILQFGPALVQEKITRPIVRKINGDAYQAFLAAHPFSDDRERSAFAERERQAIDESRELLTQEAMQAMRTGLRTSALEDLVAVVVENASERQAVVRLGLDAACAAQARAGAQSYDRLSRMPDRGLLPPKIAAEIKNKFEREMTQLFEALPKSPGATPLNFYALSLAFFAGDCLKEQMAAVREWLAD